MRTPKIYLASSWRNKHYENVLETLRSQGYETYDFKHPENNELSGFSWERVDQDYEKWACKDFKEGLNHPEAIKAFEKDFNAMQKADYCILLLPCGRSAHSEAGWMKGNGKKVFVLDLSEKPTPELMYRMFDAYLTKMDDLVESVNTETHLGNAYFGASIG